MSFEVEYVLAIDPGFTCTGIVFGKKNKENNLTLIDFAYVAEPQNMKGESECARVFDFANKIVSISLDMIANHKGRYGWSFAIEYVYYNRLNPKSLILQCRLLQAIETMMVFALNDDSNFTIHEYNPNTVKSITCKGKATKKQIKESIIQKVNISNDILQSIGNLSKASAESIYDATAVAYTHIRTEEKD